MRGFFTRFLGRPSIAICLLVAATVSGASENAPPPTDGSCPADMVYFTRGNFCVDKYEFPNVKGAPPFRGIDVEEAGMLCRSVGKRIVRTDEFRMACASVSEDSYPYGPKAIPNACRTELDWDAGPAPSGSYPACQRNGVYDLTGNVFEWVVTAAGYPIIMGGAWNTSNERANCLIPLNFQSVAISQNVGVRCAKDATPPAPK